MRSLFVLFVLIVQISSAQQKCDCEKEFAFIQTYIEANYVGFADKVTPKKMKEYTELTANLMANAKAASNDNYCLAAIKQYLEYFKDQHIQVSGIEPEPNGKDTAVINTILRNTEQFPLTKETLKELKSRKTTDIEGLYEHTSGNYKIAVIKNQTASRDYVGITTNSRNSYWKPNMVKIELKQINDSMFNGIIYNKFHTAKSVTYTITNGVFKPDEFYKQGVKMPRDIYEDEVFEKEEKKGQFIFVKALNDSTSYIRIRSFDNQFTKVIDSLIKLNEAILKSKPYMILDLRYNGGGSDQSFAPLLPYIYTNPVKCIGVDIYCTPDNVSAQERMLKEYAQYFSTKEKNEIQQLIERMKANPNRIISTGEDNIDTLKTVYANPKRIGILINGACASTTEEFLLWARQSKKVTLIGEHTAGVLDYSNVRQVNFSCMKYTLGYPTTRSRRIPDNAIDNIGIKPDVSMLFVGKDWVKNITSSMSSQVLNQK